MLFRPLVAAVATACLLAGCATVTAPYAYGVDETAAGGSAARLWLEDKGAATCRLDSSNRSAFSVARLTCE